MCFNSVTILSLWKGTQVTKAPRVSSRVPGWGSVREGAREMRLTSTPQTEKAIVLRCPASMCASAHAHGDSWLKSSAADCRLGFWNLSYYINIPGCTYGSPIRRSIRVPRHTAHSTRPKALILEPLQWDADGLCILGRICLHPRLCVQAPAVCTVAGSGRSPSGNATGPGRQAVSWIGNERLLPSWNLLSV